MTTSLMTTIFDCRDAQRVARFWGEALNYEVTKRNPGEYLASDAKGGGTDLYFMDVPEPKKGKNRLHVDLITNGDMASEVARLVDLGATVVEVRTDPATHDNPDTWTVLQDPEGNEFCISSNSTVTGWQGWGT